MSKISELNIEKLKRMSNAIRVLAAGDIKNIKGPDSVLEDAKKSLAFAEQLMTGKKSPKYIDCDLNDLISRLLSSIVLEVRNPDEELLRKIIKKYLNDRNINLSQKKLNFIANRIERSYESALEIAKKID